MRRLKRAIIRLRRYMRKNTNLKLLFLGMSLLVVLNAAKAIDDIDCSDVIHSCDIAIMQADYTISNLKKESETKDDIIKEQDVIIQQKDEQLEVIDDKAFKEKVEVGITSTVGTALLFILFIL